MKGRWISFLSISILFLFLTGCWNSRDLDEIGIVVAMGIDKVGNQYVVTVQLVNPGEISSKTGGTRAPAITFKAQGKTVFEAIRRLNKTAPRKTFYPHLRILVLGENLAREGFSKTLDLLDRLQEFRSDFYVVVAKGSRASDILNMLLPVEKIPAQNLNTKLEMSEKTWAPTSALTFGELIKDLTSPGKQAAITGIEVVGSQKAGESMKNLQSINPPGDLMYTNLAVFQRDKLKGWMTESESKGYNYIEGKVKSTIVTDTCSDHSKDVLSVELIRSHSKMKGTINDGIPEMEVTVYAEGNIAEVDCSIDLTKEKTIQEIEKQVEKNIKGKVKQSLQAAQKKFGIDIFGFGNVIHQSYPKFWKKNKKDWDKQFATLPVTVKVIVKIQRLGKKSNSYINDIK